MLLPIRKIWTYFPASFLLSHTNLVLMITTYLFRQ
jgi:hypothetical protein